VDWEALVAWRPQVVVLMPCGFSLDRTCRELNRLRTPLPAQLLSDSSIYAVDGNAYFNRMGPRLVDSLELLAHLLHPEVDELAEAAPRHAIRRLAV
jgi:iron complex transport system substrate-binding protein